MPCPRDRMGLLCVIPWHGGVPGNGGSHGGQEAVQDGQDRGAAVRAFADSSSCRLALFPACLGALGESATQNGGVMSIIPLLEQSAFEPETIEMLVSVFEDAWRKVEESGSKLASPAYRRAAQEIIAKRIIETAQGGESNPRQLADDAVDYLQKSYA